MKKLEVCSHRRKLTIGGTVLLLIVMFVLMVCSIMELNFSRYRTCAAYIVTMPVTQYRKDKRIYKKLKHDFSSVKLNIMWQMGSSNNPLDFSGEGIPNKSTITLNFYDKKDRKRSFEPSKM
jgi:hypothetical protein